MSFFLYNNIITHAFSLQNRMYYKFKYYIRVFCCHCCCLFLITFLLEVVTFLLINIDQVRQEKNYVMCGAFDKDM